LEPAALLSFGSHGCVDWQLWAALRLEEVDEVVMLMCCVQKQRVIARVLSLSILISEGGSKVCPSFALPDRKLTYFFIRTRFLSLHRMADSSRRRPAT
jgi:hypothetical protein